MTSRRQKPRIFIASSTEQLEIAYAIQENLDFDAEVTIWNQGVLKPSDSTLNNLVAVSHDFEFAVFVFTPDDISVIRGEKVRIVRDNLIFELGLFVGALGVSRCYFVIPRGAEAPQLPTDLLGITALTYAADRSDRNLVAALGPACNQIRRAIRELPGPASTGGLAPAHLTTRERTMEFIETWNGDEIRAIRADIRELPLDPYGEEFQLIRPKLDRLFSFLESMADALLSGRIDETLARPVFEQPVHVLWPYIYTHFAPLNQADEWWDPIPRLGELHARWIPMTVS
jgi:predicted nucleotide-binding protein with TIR-like domain